MYHQVGAGFGKNVSGGHENLFTEQSKEADQMPSGETARPEIPEPVWWPLRFPTTSPLVRHLDNFFLKTQTSNFLSGKMLQQKKET